MKLDASYGGENSTTGGNTGNNTDLIIKQEPSAVSDAEMHALAKDRQKKDNHNMSLYQIFHFLFSNTKQINDLFLFYS